MLEPSIHEEIPLGYVGIQSEHSEELTSYMCQAIVCVDVNPVDL